MIEKEMAMKVEREAGGRWARWALLLAALGMPLSWAQEAGSGDGKEKAAQAVVAKTEGAAADGQQPETEKREVISFERTLDFDLTEEQKERFQKNLPNAYRKLSQRKPFHIVALGDSIVDMTGYDDDAQNWIKGYPAQFAAALARQFFYAGGVRVIKPPKGRQSKEQAYMGKEITVRNLGRGGKLSFHAIQALSTYGMEVKPDLVLLSFGINDATTGLDLASYVRAFREVIGLVREAGGEVILLAPTLTVSNPPEEDMAKTRPYADTLREVAEESGAFFVDLGDLDGLVTMPEEVTEPLVAFGRVVEEYRRFFDHDKNVIDFVHPRVSLHEQLGKKIYRELIDGKKPAPWQMGKATAQLTANQELELSVEVSNPSDGPVQMMMLPLVTNAWRPQEAKPELNLKMGATEKWVIRYKRRDDGRGAAANPMPSHEPLLRLPFLVTGADIVRVETVRAELQPAVLLWQVETLFNQEGEFVPANLLVNTSGKALEAKWEATWMGASRSGEVKLAAGEKVELPIRFALPEVGTIPFYKQTKLSVLITLGTQVLRFDRNVDLSRNFGLKETISMSPFGATESPKLPLLGDRNRSVTLRADADSENLFLTFEVRGIDLKDGPPGTAAWVGTVNLDARSYGKRLTHGVTDALRFSGPATDGPADLGDIPPWAFGTGYAAQFEKKHIKCVLASGNEGVRRITLTVPRSYLYLHEWALKNGNSQLGVYCTLTFWQPKADGTGGGSYPGDLTFYLTRNRHRDEVESHAVVELSDEPTKRWTITVY
jgi:lysophospholipase L1-like esterase